MSCWDAAADPALPRVRAKTVHTAGWLGTPGRTGLPAQQGGRRTPLVCPLSRHRDAELSPRRRPRTGRVGCSCHESADHPAPYRRDATLGLLGAVDAERHSPPEWQPLIACHGYSKRSVSGVYSSRLAA